MGYTQVALENKLLEMYPQIQKYGLSISLSFDTERNAWIISFQKGKHKRYAILDKKDADDCMDGNMCIYLGTLIAQYIKDLEKEITGK
ncbi:MAG: hypothetical protein ACM34I_02140 [bacterium]